MDAIVSSSPWRGKKATNARHYDPEIARFVTADTVTDGPETIKGWNRYMYVGGNPIMHKDPTGHFGAGTGGIAGEAYVKGMSAIADHEKESQKEKKTPEATGAMGILWESVKQSDKVILTKDGMQKLMDDPAMQEYEKKVIKNIKKDPRYGKKAFIREGDPAAIRFGGDRGYFPWQPEFNGTEDIVKTLDVATNEQTWMVRTATVTYTANIDADGNIDIEWRVYDVFDLRKGKKDRGSYDKAVDVLGTIWHDLLGITDKMTVEGTYKKKYPNYKKNIEKN